jgi:hypothetical protein
LGYIGRQPTNAILTSDDIAAGSVSKDKVSLISNGTAGLTVKGDNGSNDGYLQLNCRVNSHGIKLKSPPHSAAQSYTLTFPSTAPATDKILQTDSSGNLSFADAGGITMADQFRLNADFNIPTSESFITSNLERSDARGAGSLGSIQMSESSGVFTFPSTGFYLVTYMVQFYTSANNGNLLAAIYHTSNNSSYSKTALIQQSTNANQSISFGSGATQVILDITDTSNQKVKFSCGAGPSGTPGVVRGETNQNETSMLFIRLGDT